MHKYPNPELLKLRAWYLARLRKAALLEEQAVQATPSTLIKSDKDNIAKLAAASLAKEATLSATPRADLYWLAAFVLACSIAIVLLTAPL